MTKIRNLTILIFILLNQLSAQETSKFAEGANKVVDIISGLADQYIQGSQQQSQQYIQMIQQQQMLSQMTPQVAPASSVSTFPNCPIPALTSPPEGMCSNIQGPDAFMMAQNIKATALKYSASFDQFLSRTPTGVGISCIDLSIKKLTQDLSAKSNQLQAMIDQTKKGQQFFAEEANAIKKQMEKISNELYGGGGDVEEIAKDYTSMFPGCRGIIPSDALTKPKGGLIGIRNSIDNTGMRTAAQNLLTNKATYAKEIEEVVERIKADANDVGIDVFFEGGATQSKWFKGGLTQFGGVEQILMEKRKEMDIKRARIAEDLAAVGYKSPRMDQKFRKKMGEFAGGATVYFQKKYINDCVLGGNEMIRRLGLKQDELLQNLQQVGLKKQGGAVMSYRNKLEAILNGPGFLDEKISQIKDLEKIYGTGSFYLFYKNSSGGYSKETPDQYFKNMIGTCEKAYESGGALAKDTPGGSTYKEKVENAQTALNELNQMEEGFTGSIGNLLKDKLLNCSNTPMKEGSCSPETMTSTNPDFCLKRASFCAERTRACFTHADNLVKERTNKLKINANLYNKKIEALVVNQEAELAKIKTLVNNDIAALKQMFPGATFESPPDLVVALPAPVDTPLGVQLRGGGSMSFLNSLPEQLKKIKKAMEDHGSQALNEARDYQMAQEGQMKESKAAWQALAAQCDSSMAEFGKNYEENMNKAMEEQAKLGSEVGEFCYKYERLANSNPLAGCDGDNSPSKLYDDAIKVATFINPTVINNLGEYEKLCAQSQNRPELGTESDKRPELIRLCEIAGDDWNKVLTIKKEELLRKISDPKIKARAKSFLDAKGEVDPNLSNLPPSVYRQLINLRQMEAQKANGRDALIDELNGEVRSKEEVKFEEIKASLSSMKKEMDNFKFKGLKKELDNIEKNLTPSTIEKARTDLASLISKSPDFEKEVGPENSENLKSQFEELKALSESISQKSLDALPDLAPSGLGSEHKDLFKKGDDVENLCLALKNQKISDAIADCSENKGFDKCFKRQMEINADEIGPGLFDILNRKLNSISNFEDAEMIAERWSDLGQGGKESCTGQSSQGRKAKEPEKKDSDKILDDLKNILQGKEI